MKKLSAPMSVLSAVALLAGCGDDDSMMTAPDSEAPSQAPAHGRSMATFQVVVENLTPATEAGASQVFSPPVLTTHGPRMSLFEVGEMASSEVAAIAEDAVNQPLLDRLSESPHVLDHLAGGGPIPPGGSATYEIRAAREKRLLSMVFMLVNTNDAFSGLNRLRLRPNGEEVLYVNAYDAGSEENTELASHIPGPCCGNPLQRVPTEEPISPHPGILGHGDLDPEVWGWEGPVARITIRRIDD